MEDINMKMQTSHTGTIVTGTGPESTYVLAQCYGDLSTSECLLCVAEARTSIPTCLPNIGGRVYLQGCFMRFENYSFFGELTGKDDRIVCDNITRKDDGFQQAASKAVLQAVETAPKRWNRHAGTQNIVSGSQNKSAYAAADCWSTLGEESCAQCLQNASNSMLGCLPGSMGYALYTGCFIRYSDTSFSNPDRKGRSKGSNDTEMLKIVSSSSLNIKYSTIEKATNSFDEAKKLGQGGFGAVYKGVLPNGMEIAVKRLFFNHRHRAADFYNEVNIISSVDHKNLVKLVGFSYLGPESALIYEYISNGSLNHFIFGRHYNFLKFSKKISYSMNFLYGWDYPDTFSA
ncbi:putative protein kinase RLK-Pelle-DLSV family [Helianthus annuus]|nr:putative protein kinase RLK-Pelle-DLSV family [Helianthus annuus]